MTLLVQLRRELAAFFLSPIAYVLLTAANVINGLVFAVIVEYLSNPMAGRGAAMEMLFGGTPFYFLLVIGASSFLTMRLLAEEKRAGTIETLLTAPISDLTVVLAKYLAAVLFYIVMWLPKLIYVAWLTRQGSVDLGPIAAGYLGTLLLGVMFLAIGLFFSAVTRSQIVAALLSFAANLALYIVGVLDYIWSTGTGDSWISYVNVWRLMEDFGRGIVDTRHIVYCASVTLFALFATVQVVQARRWR